MFAFSMAFHVLLNAIYEFIVHDANGFFFSSSHYDIWTREKMSSTIIAIDIDLLLASQYYILFHETDKKVQISAVSLFVVCMMYVIIMGRRTQLFLYFILMLASLLYEALILRSFSKKKQEYLKNLFFIFFLIALAFACMYHFNLFSIHSLWNDFRIIQKLKQGLTNDERFFVLFESLKYMPRYLFGGQKISTVLGLQVHNFWLDIYDYAGIIPFILIVVYSLWFLHVFLKLIREKSVSFSFKTLTVGLFLCFFIQLNLEPMMTCASIFVIICVIFESLIEEFGNE